jgi:hypothetical protein
MNELLLAFLAITQATPMLVAALPINETEPAWMPEPKGRGTMGILLPCLITLGLCVWTAIHLNVDPIRTRTRFLLFKTGWVLAGILAPELVLTWAFVQFMEARAVRRHMHILRRTQFRKPNQAADDMNEGEASREEKSSVQRFDMASAFFVVMGGYTILPALGPGAKGLPLTVTPYGFLVLYAKGELKEGDLDTKHIQDKSKADSLAKFLVCIQALVWVTVLELEFIVNCWPSQWLVFQCLGRLASGLPIPLLELHTVMHVLCAVVMYGFWLDKPLDVGVPIRLNLNTAGLAQEIYDSFEQHTFATWEGGHSENPAASYADDRPLLDIQEQRVSTPSEYPDAGEDNDPHRSSENLERSESQSSKPGGNVDRLLRDNQYIKGNTFGARWKRFWNAEHNIEEEGPRLLGVYKYWHKTFQIKPPAGDQETPRKASTFFSELPDDLLPSVDRKAVPLRTRARMQGTSGYITGEDNSLGLAIVLATCLALLYGGAHAAAWNTHFPSSTEQLLWRVCSITVGTMILLSLLLILMISWLNELLEEAKVKELFHRVFNVFPEMLSDILMFFGMLFIAGAILFYVFARAFLVVEAFLSLRSLPKGSFETVPWSDYWPHF